MKAVRCLGLLALLTAIQLVVAPVGAHAQSFTIEDLGTLGGETSIAWRINSSGQVVGMSALPSGEQHAFLWLGGPMQDLGTLGGDYSSAFSINDAGWVVGEARATAGGPARAFLWKDDVIQDLGTLGGPSASALDINTAGLVAGAADDAGGLRKAVVWGPDGIQEIAGLDAVVAVNAAGDAAGFAGGVAYLLHNGTLIPLSTAIAGKVSFAADIGGGGQFAFNAYPPDFNGPTQAWRWVDGTLTDLGHLGGVEASAFGISDAGVVVGTSNTADARPHAFFYRDMYKMVDLNLLLRETGRWELQAATDVNAKGQIVGWGLLDGQQHAFRLTPAGRYRPPKPTGPPAIPPTPTQ